MAANAVQSPSPARRAFATCKLSASHRHATLIKPTLLISSKVIAEFGPRLNEILAGAPKPLELLPFTAALQLTPGAIDNIDVFNNEPLPPESPFWDLPNVLISPHNAGASTGTYARGVEIFLRNLSNYLRAQPLENEASVG